MYHNGMERRAVSRTSVESRESNALRLDVAY